jgi:glycerol uptake facilitator-like aquaporin
MINQSNVMPAETPDPSGPLHTSVVLQQLLDEAQSDHVTPRWLMGRLRRLEAVAYGMVQVACCCAGALLAHTMFELPIIQSSAHVRAGPAQWLSEGVATGGLLLVVLGHRRSEEAPWMVAAWIGGAFWFTPSTSFANPAITIAQSLTSTFSGIRPADVPGFVGAQVVGALMALAV